MLILAALMATQAGTGLAVSSLYRDAQLWMLAAWRGNDLVTLTVAAPGLAWAALRARRGSTRGGLLALGLLWFNLYNDVYYVFGASLNAAFPLYVALLVLGGAALGSSLRALPVDALPARFDADTPARSAGAVLVVVGGLLAAVWLVQWGVYLRTGRTPAIGLEPMRLIAAMDLSMIAPTLIAGGALLWRRRPWGFVLAHMGAVLGGAYALVLSASTAVGLRQGLPGMAAQLPGWIGLAAVMAATLVGLLRHVRDREA